MVIRSIAFHGLVLSVMLACMGLNSDAQVGNAKASSATQVAAEMTKGKLNPSESKPGDKVTLKLRDDVKSNGEVVLKRGTTITGVVRSVKRVEGKGEAKDDAKSETKGQAQSLMEIDWLAPSAQGKATQQLSIAMQSVTQVNPLYQHRQEEASESDFGLTSRSSAAGSASGSIASSAGGAGGGLLGGAAGAVGATTGVATGVLGAASSTVSSSVGSVGTVSSTAANTTGSAAANTRSNVALLSMPTVVAADSSTAAALESTFGMSSGSQLFKVGRGELITAGGSKQSLEIFSHLKNDTVLTSQSKNFEISSGAQMQLLIGVQKN